MLKTVELLNLFCVKTVFLSYFDKKTRQHYTFIYCHFWPFWCILAE